MTELESQRFRVATYNVLDPGFGTLAPWDVRRRNVGQTIEASAASLIALQEAGWTRLPSGVTVAEDIATLTGLELSRASFSGDAFVFDPRIWTEGDFGHILLPRGRGDRRRSMIWQRFRHSASGETFLFVATHLSHGPERDRVRIRQTRRLVRRARSMSKQGQPTIILGDFNSWDGRAPVTPLTVLSRAGFAEAVPHGHGHRLDHIATSGGVRLIAVEVAEPALPGPASDHHLVWAELELVGAP